MTQPPNDPRKSDDEPRCSFCGRRRSEVKAMFRSEDARICDRCVLTFKGGGKG